MQKVTTLRVRSGLDDYTAHNERQTTDALTQAERAERDAGSRRLLLTLLGSVVVALAGGIGFGYALLALLA